MITSAKTPLYAVPVASTSFSKEAKWVGDAGEIRFSYRTELQGDQHGENREVRIRFQRPMVLLKRAEPFCRVEHIEHCYDTLVEVSPSPWLEAEYTASARRASRMKDAHHYMIYLDSVGCFEVIAEGWTVDDLRCEQSEVQA